ncbi:MAG: hypothetical protein COA39_008810 [Sulfurimonas sp.]|nr:hypothetical protein [Sulfurimonas sp.]
MPGLPTFSSYEERAEVVKTDIFFSISIGISEAIKSIIIAIPFGFLIIDISSWWITSLYPAFTWFRMIGGFG